MRALCVARHRILSDHLCRFFDALGLDTVPCVGLLEMTDAARAGNADVVICDYDLLTAHPPAGWGDDDAVRGVPILAVSLTRRPDDLPLIDPGEIAGFLYLPTLAPDDALRVLAALRHAHGAITPPDAAPWPAPIRAAELR